MDQPLTSLSLRALDDSFHAVIERSRADPAPTLAERLDRQARLRAAVADNEGRFQTGGLGRFRPPLGGSIDSGFALRAP
jgi:hypothetical protein